MNTEPSTLEVLRHARASVIDPSAPFKFADYAVCTCGHIYRAAKGEYSSSGAAGNTIDPLYERVIIEVARALGMSDSWLEAASDIRARSASYWVSYQTKSEVRLADRVERKHALAVIDRAIAEIEAAEASAMLDVLKERKTVARKDPSEEVALARLTKEAHHG